MARCDEAAPPPPQAQLRGKRPSGRYIGQIRGSHLSNTTCLTHASNSIHPFMFIHLSLSILNILLYPFFLTQAHLRGLPAEKSAAGRLHSRLPRSGEEGQAILYLSSPILIQYSTNTNTSTTNTNTSTSTNNY